MNSDKGMARPTVCPNCDSPRIVPVVEGTPDEVIETLLAQGKIACCGCFALDNGSAIWACGDCGQRIGTPEYTMRREDPNIVRAYESAVQEVFAQYWPISKSELRKLDGLRFIAAVVRKRLLPDTDEIRLRLEHREFTVAMFAGATERESVRDAVFNVDRFVEIREAAEETARERKGLLSIRVGKQCCVVRVVVVSPREVRICRTEVASGSPESEPAKP